MSKISPPVRPFFLSFLGLGPGPGEGGVGGAGPGVGVGGGGGDGDGDGDGGGDGDGDGAQALSHWGVVQGPSGSDTHWLPVRRRRGGEEKKTQNVCFISKANEQKNVFFRAHRFRRRSFAGSLPLMQFSRSPRNCNPSQFQKKKAASPVARTLAAVVCGAAAALEGKLVQAGHAAALAGRVIGAGAAAARFAGERGAKEAVSVKHMAPPPTASALATCR